MIAPKQKRTAVPAAPDGVTHHAPSRLARRFHQICLGILSEISEPYGLSPIEYGALGSLDIEPGIDQAGLAILLGIDKVSAHHMVDEFEAQGLIRRKVDPNDRRSRALSLTSAGTKMFRDLHLQMRAAHDRILASLSTAERITFLKLLKRIVDANQEFARPGNGRRRLRRKGSKSKTSPVTRVIEANENLHSFGPERRPRRKSASVTT